MTDASAPDTPPSDCTVVHVAVGVLLEQRDGQTHALITRRHDDNVLGGFWEFPGGKVEPNEPLSDCAVRELREEVGVVVETYQELPAIQHTYDHATVRLHPFLCRRASGEPRAIEVAAWQWVPVDQLGDYDFPPANQPLIDAVQSDTLNTTDGAP